MTRQSLKARRRKSWGLTISADANQPQLTCTSDGVHPDAHVLKICTMNSGIPELLSRLCDMLMSWLVHTPKVAGGDRRSKIRIMKTFAARSIVGEEAAMEIELSLIPACTVMPQLQYSP